MDEPCSDDDINGGEDGDDDTEPHPRIDPTAGGGPEDGIASLAGMSLNNKMRPAPEPHHKSNHV
jgi:hypothetical protein